MKIPDILQFGGIALLLVTWVIAVVFLWRGGELPRFFLRLDLWLVIAVLIGIAMIVGGRIVLARRRSRSPCREGS